MVRFLDQGGMGSVYLAEDENLKRLVAIKIINADLTHDPELKRRFTNEALIIAAFQHLNIITVFASGWLGEKPYFVMEYVSGGTLGHRMGTERLPEQAAYRIGFQMADALAYSHERNVIHRDFKPSNILLRENGTPVLSDFGIAKSDMRTGGETQIGTVIGSERYMAPEQAMGQRVSNRADIYSFGLVLHQMLLGELPERHPIRSQEDARQLARSLRFVAPACSDLIQRCLQVVPERRPTAAECRDALDAIGKRPEKSKGLWVAMSGVAVAVTLGVFGLWRMGLLSGQGEVKPGLKAPASSPQATMVSLTVRGPPKSAKVFVDGQELANSSISIPVGQHEWVAVASGYYGRIGHVSWTSSDTDVSVDMTLKRTVLPSREETQHFLKLTESQNLTAADVESITEPTLHEALLAQRLSQTDRLSELETLMHDVDTLRRFGDSRAAVTALLVDSMRAGKPSRGLVTQALLAASDDGDPMASLFIAMTYRESLNSSNKPLATADPLYRSYCQYLARTISQGWADVANESWHSDRCVN